MKTLKQFKALYTTDNSDTFNWYDSISYTEQGVRDDVKAKFGENAKVLNMIFVQKLRTK